MRSVLLGVFLLLVFGFACKHKEKEVTISKKQVASKPVASTKVNAGPKSGTTAHSELRNKIGLTNKQINNSPLYSFVADWYGTPYKYSGCQRTGVDCSCFTNILYDKVYNKKIPRSASEIYSICKKKGLEDAREGDLLFFKISGNIISHVGILLRNKYFVHSSTSKGVVISSMNEAYYKKYFFCAGEVRNS